MYPREAFGPGPVCDGAQEPWEVEFVPAAGASMSDAPVSEDGCGT